MELTPCKGVPSPTNATLSEISSHRADSHATSSCEPLRDKPPVSSAPVDSYQVARTHYDELRNFLAPYLAKEPVNSPRQNLAGVTRQQFHELSTDVYCELIRRKTNHSQVPFLPPREGFHPKRNQARQNLATLSANRFRDLSSDVYHELVRRYPEFKEEPSGISMTPPGSAFPSPDVPITLHNRNSEPPAPAHVHEDRGHPPSSERTPGEYKSHVSTMQSRIVSLKRQIEDVEVHARQLEQSYPLVQQLEDELGSYRRRTEEQSALILALQKELDNVREEAQRSREREVTRAQMDEKELRVHILHERERELASATDSDRLRSDTEGFISEVSNLSRRSDELMTSEDHDFLYVNATSPPLLKTPKPDDQGIAMSADGAISDAHLTAFFTAIDTLLFTGRSNAQSRVLTPMTSVVNAVTNILDSMRSHSRRQLDPEGVQALEERVEATLSNLVTASKTHATSSGLSPVSLLDAAAGHVSAAVTELTRVVHLRRATKAEQEQFAASSFRTTDNSFTPCLRTVEEVRPSVAWQGEWEREREREQLARSELRSNNHSRAGSEGAWIELRPYLEAQTESVIYAIRGVLSVVRSSSPTSPPSPMLSPSLNEDLTQIIATVSSIVAACQDKLPASRAQQGGDILRELSEHANKLGEVRALPGEVAKESRQVMLKSGFAIVNAMETLQKL